MRMLENEEVKVWDPFVRLFHWLLLAAFFTCYVTEGKPRWVHVNSGYVIGVLVVLRVIWGAVGPVHARFGDFVRGPGEVLSHLRDVALFKAKRYLGHDPAGGAMIVALLVMLSLTVLSGMLFYGAHDNAGPFAGRFAETRYELPSLDGVAYADEGKEGKHGRGREGKKGGAKWLEEVHEVLANVTLALVVAHICGVLLVSLQTRENLVLGMITGRKRGRRPVPDGAEEL